MTGLADERPFIRRAHGREESLHQSRLERERGWQLHEDRSALHPEAGRLVQESIEHVARLAKGLFVGERPWELHREAEPAGVVAAQRS